MAARVADVLLYLQKDGYKSETYTINLTRQDLADLAAMSKESFIRTPKELKDNGMVKVIRNKISILNTVGLKKISKS